MAKVHAREGPHTRALSRRCALPESRQLAGDEERALARGPHRAKGETHTRVGAWRRTDAAHTAHATRSTRLILRSFARTRRGGGGGVRETCVVPVLRVEKA